MGGRGAGSGGGNLPGLTGSEKQIKWAKEIRDEFKSILDIQYKRETKSVKERLEKHPDSRIAQMAKQNDAASYKKVKSMLSTETDSKFFIEEIRGITSEMKVAERSGKAKADSIMLDRISGAWERYKRNKR